MKLVATLGLVVLVLAGAVAAAYPTLSKWRKERNTPQWREEVVTKGTIISTVNSTGTIKPVMSVQVGSFVSGPIDDSVPLAEFNQEVKKGDPLAKIDPRIYEASRLRDLAVVKIRVADVTRAEALLKQATNDEARAKSLDAENTDFISDAEMDQVKFNRMSLAAQLEVAKASLEQAEANLENSEANLDYTNINAPVDAIVINRTIEPGGTLAAQFQTPELFVLAPNMREEMHVYASVDEADIGLIRDAQRRSNRVEFTVDAYPDDLFEGTIKEVRFNSTTTQNVVTYPVLVTTTNPELKLLPGMTASISFHVEEQNDVLKIPNAALRFYPPEVYVREEDKKILEGGAVFDAEAEDDGTEVTLSASEQAEASRKNSLRHVWVAEEGKLRAVEVEVGISDSKYSELVSGELKEDMKLVVGNKPKR